MIRKLFLLLLLTVYCSAPLAQTQDPAPSPPTTASPSEEVDEEEEEAIDDNFRPTEKINVDSSVSFPVDI